MRGLLSKRFRPCSTSAAFKKGPAFRHRMKSRACWHGRRRSRSRVKDPIGLWSARTKRWRWGIVFSASLATLPRQQSSCGRWPARPTSCTPPLSADEIRGYLDEAGDAATSSVGAYQLEKLGVHLFERIEGDHFTILGLPLLPLLAFFRGEGLLGP